MGNLKTIGSLAVMPSFGSSDYELISKVILSSTSTTIDFTSIPQTYRHLEIFFVGRSAYTTGSTDTTRIRINGDTTGNYDYQWHYNSNATTSAGGESFANTSISVNGNTPNANANVGAVGTSRILLLDYARTNWQKTLVCQSHSEYGTAAGNRTEVHCSGYWRNTSPISSLLFFLTNASFAIGTMVALYGLKGVGQ